MPLLLGSASVVLGAQSVEEVARNLFRQGAGQYQTGDYDEARKNFEMVVTIHPETQVADDAMLRLAEYELSIRKSPDAAEARIKALQSKYSGRIDTVPLSYIVEGRIALLRGLTPTLVKSSISSFDRVRAYEGHEAIPEAMYRAAEAARVGGMDQEAARRHNELTTAYPRSDWTARALIGSALSLVRGGQWARAMDQLQRVRSRTGSTEAEGTRAIDLNTILHRLHIRANGPAVPLQTAPAFPGLPPRFRDVSDIAVGSDGRIAAATNAGVAVYLPAGTQRTLTPLRDPVGFLSDFGGHLLTIHDQGIVHNEAGRSFSFGQPTADGRTKRVEIRAGVVTASGEYLVADAESKTVQKFVEAGDGQTVKHVGEFARGDARRMAISELDEVAALDDRGQVVVWGRSGQIAVTVPRQGDGYRLDDPIGVAYDALGHLYVLDKGLILVFAPASPKLVTTFLLPPRVDPLAIGVDGAGRLYVFDKRTQAVQIYR